MQPKPALSRIALIDECGEGETGFADSSGERSASPIGRILEDAGYEVVYTRNAATNEDDNDVSFVVRVSNPRTRSSGFVVDRPGSNIVPANSQRPTEQARINERMESIAQLAGGVAHDFNNILSVVSICVDEVLETLATHDPNRECLGDIRHAVDRGAAVTRDLLAFSRRDIQTVRVVDFNEVVTDSQRLIARVLGDDVTLHVTLAATDAFVRIDPSQWTSVLLNLAANARQSIDALATTTSPTTTTTNAGASLTLQTRDVEIEPWVACGRDKPKGRYVELEITDTGCGIAEDIQSRIFDPFFTTKGLGKRSGLGLSVVHGVVERSGGFIDVISPTNKETETGTTFRVYIPITAAPASAAAESQQPQTQTATVMIVEDEDALRRVAIKTLERQGYTVLHAATAEDALALLEQSPLIDLIVTDVVLPKMDGRQLARVVASRYPKVEVLFTSGYTDDEALRFGIAREEVHFLPKPYTAKLLVARVEEVLDLVKRRRA